MEKNKTMKNLCFFFVMAMTLLACNFEPSSQTNSTFEEKPNTKDRILFIVSNAHYYGTSDIGTANHFSEIVLPYDVLIKASFPNSE